MAPRVKNKVQRDEDPGPDVASAHARPARQERSRRMVERLLEAARAVLASEGLAAATVPRIARQAGVSVGAVYRRFPDKDALMRAVYEQVARASREHNRAMLAPERWKGVPAEDVARTIVHGMTQSNLVARGLLRALNQYVETHPDPAFRQRAEAQTAETLDRIATLMLAYRGDIHHPEPRRGLDFGLVALAYVLRGFLISEDEFLLRWMPAEEQLGDELTRMFLGYLGLPQDEVHAPWIVPLRGMSREARMAFVESQNHIIRDLFSGESKKGETRPRRASASRPAAPTPARTRRARGTPSRSRPPKAKKRARPARGRRARSS